MSFDATSIGLMALALTALGILATLVAPRIAPVARLHAQIENAFEIKRDNVAGDLAILITHKGEVVPDRVFLIDASVENTGSMDVVSDHFVNPIEFTFPDSMQVLSAESTAAAGVDPVLQTTSNKTAVRWSILKPKEKVSLKVIVACLDKNIESDDVSGIVDTTVRLIDVRTGRRFLQNHRRKALAVAAALAIALVMAATYFFTELPRRSDIVMTSSDQAVFGDRFGGFKRCKVHAEFVLFDNCSPISGAEISDRIPQSSIGSGWIGMSRYSIWLTLGFSVFYGLLVAFTPRTIARYLRKAHRDRERRKRTRQALS